MDKKQARTALLSAALALLAVCVLLAGATYAWFTFDTYTKVVPMEARISDGDMNLLISESRKGPFDVSCPLNPENYAKVLYPVSTADLDVFHLDKNQNGEIVIDYRLATQEDLNHSVIYGTVYLKSEGHSCDIFLKAPPLSLGSDPQWLAAGRLGLQITGRDGKKLKFILRLDSLGQTGTAQTAVTVDSTGSVVVNAAGQLTNDPSEPISKYLYGVGTPTALCSMRAGEIARVDYWLYLEGCDTACVMPVQERQLALQLGFIGRRNDADSTDETMPTTQNR